MESTLIRKGAYWQGLFKAMASPCEILIDNVNKKLATSILKTAENETRRIEDKFSRYRDDNIIYKINSANGSSIDVDDETARLLNYANQCYQLSEGNFDITSGVLRKVWKFDGSDNIAEQKDIAPILRYVGWDKINWQYPSFAMKPGMQIDFGGIGKEYAADKVALLIAEKFNRHVLVNFGGDIVVTGPRRNNKPWEIGLQNPDDTKNITTKIELKKGAIATSGDLNRFLFKNKQRYSHILNPHTGWPVEHAPRQVTVMAQTCIEAGMLSTFAILEGKDAEDFLKAQEVDYRIIW